MRKSVTKSMLQHSQKNKDWTRWLFVLPAMLVVLSLLVYPLFSTFYYSFTDKTLISQDAEFIGLENYINILSDSDFLRAFLTTLKWTFFSLLGQILVGFTGALALNRVKKTIPRTIYRICMIIPWAFPSVAIALVWDWMLNGIQGFIPSLLVQLGLTDNMVQFLSNPDLVLPTLVCINIWFGAPMIMVNVYASLQTVPQDQYEAAKIDGANALQSFAYITAPHIKVVVGLLVVLRTIWVFNNFDIIFMTTAGGPSGVSRTMPIYIYEMGWRRRMVGRASAASILLMLFLIVVSILYFIIITRWEKEEK